ncbi:MAG: MGMT family protein [bacterium]
MTIKISKKINIAISKYSKFYQRVWRKCCTIPRGETRTYEWIAKSIGSPKAHRAVANALANNPFAPAIPCHRVIRKDGKLGGYSGKGGIQSKKRLLKEEG